MCCSYQEYAIEACKNLSDQYSWDFCFFQTSRQTINIVNKFFPNSVKVDYLSLVKGSILENKNILPRSEIIESMKVDGSFEIAIRMFNRNESFGANFPKHERIELITMFIGYWAGIIKDFNLDLVIFEEVPHQVSDYILYLVCKYLNCKCIVPIRTMPRSGFLISDRFDHFELLESTGSYFPNNYKSLRECFDDMTGLYSAYAKNVFFDAEDTLSIYKKQKTKRKYLSLFFRKFSNLAKILCEGGEFQNDQRQIFKPLNESNESLISHFVKIFLTRRRKIYLKRYYSSLSVKDIPDGKFVFFALQYEPEATTCPRGGGFFDQLKTLQKIYSCLPDDWLLLIKEHPNQFSSRYARFAENARSKEFYDQLSQHSRVRLVDLSVPSFEVIDKAKLVASVGGTVCLEALARGKPSANFGTAFFDHVRGISKILHMEQFAQLLGILKDEDPKVNLQQAKDDLEKVDNAVFYGAIGGPGALREIGLSQRDNAVIHASAWYGFVQGPEISRH